MASLSNFRPVKTPRGFALGLVIIAGLAHGTLSARQVTPLAQDDALRPAPATQATVNQQDVDALPSLLDPQLDPAPDPAPESEAQPVVVPQSLDDLIPPDAVTNPNVWAAAGVADPSPVAVVADGALAVPALGSASPLPDGALAGASPPLEPGLLPVTGDIFADFALETPEPLASDPTLEALASIAAPVGGAVPDLAETRISGTLVLAMPTTADAFPEKDEFTARFKDLSTLRALDDGDQTRPQVAARARSDEVLLGDILRTYGYYDGEVVRQLSGGRRAGSANDEAAEAAAEEPSVRFDILPGDRYRFGRIDLGALPAVSEPDASRLIAAFGIKPGDPLYADRIVEREIELRVALGESGYPFAEVAEPELLIDHARTEGDLLLPVQPGGKYVFGQVVSSDDRFLSGRHLAEIARFGEGDVFQQSLETDLRRAVIATGLVSTVTITPRETRAPNGSQPGEVALDVGFDRAPLRTIAGAIGYGTEDGFKLEGRWEHRNLFPPEGALRVRGILGTRESLASIGVRRNNFRGRDQVLTVDLFGSDITTQAVDSRGFGMRGTFEKVSNILFQKPLSWQIGGELLFTDERNRDVRIAPGGPTPRRSFLIGGLFGSVTLDASDDLLDPSEGYRATLFLAPEASRSQGTETFYLRAQGDAAYYQSVGSTVLAGRVRAATIQGAGIDDIAPSRRLYGGGGASVRGYGFQGVGPRDTVGNPTGGGSLIEFALEARVETPLFDGAVEIVPFIDAGSVSRGTTPDFNEIRWGAGIGIRYKTTFGPIRIDVAAPINPTPFDSPVVVYVSLGQAF